MILAGSIIALYLIWSWSVLKYLDFAPDASTKKPEVFVSVIVHGIQQNYLYHFNYNTNEVTRVLTYAKEYIYLEKTNTFLSKRQWVYYSLGGLILYHGCRRTLKEFEKEPTVRKIQYLTLEQIKDYLRKGEKLCDVMSRLDKSTRTKYTTSELTKTV